jgi:hypothetical protein
MVGHIGYELLMVGCLMYRTADERDLDIGYAILESYLLHVRNLSTFLKTPAKAANRNDVVADDYFAEPHTYSPLAGRDHGLLDQYLAHITTARLNGNVPGVEGFSWRRGQDRSYWGLEVLQGFGRFLGDLAAESPERAAWFQEHYQLAVARSLPPPGVWQQTRQGQRRIDT